MKNKIKGAFGGPTRRKDKLARIQKYFRDYRAYKLPHQK